MREQHVQAKQIKDNKCMYDADEKSSQCSGILYKDLGFYYVFQASKMTRV